MAEVTWLDEAKKNAGLLIVLGVLTVVFGVLAVGAPLMTGVAVTILVGSLMVLMGILQVVHAFKAQQWGVGLWGTVVGVLAVIAGLFMLVRPVAGLAALTLFLAAYFLADGLCEVIVGIKMKPDQGWGWMVFNGAVAVLLGFFIWRQWPVSGSWAIGVLVGIHILLSGWSMIILGTGARRIAGAVEDAVEDAVDYAEDVAEKAGDVVEKVADKAEDLAEDAVDKAGDEVETVADKAKDLAEAVADKAKDLVDRDKV